MKRGIFFTVICALLASSLRDAVAGPLYFSNAVALQDNGFASVDLFSNPGVTLLVPPNSRLNFIVDITGALDIGTTDTLRVTYTQDENSPVVSDFSIPIFGTVFPPFSILFSMPTGLTYQPIAATLMVDLLGSSPDFVVPEGGTQVDSYTYGLKVVQPVPEPMTLVLLGSGLLIALRKRNIV